MWFSSRPQNLNNFFYLRRRRSFRKLPKMVWVTYALKNALKKKNDFILFVSQEDFFGLKEVVVVEVDVLDLKVLISVMVQQINHA